MRARAPCRPHHRSPSPRRAPLHVPLASPSARFLAARRYCAHLVPPRARPRRDRGSRGPRVAHRTMTRMSVSRKAPSRAFGVPPVLSPAGGSPHGHHDSRVRDPGAHRPGASPRLAIPRSGAVRLPAESAMPGTPVERLSQCAQLLPRLSAATATLPGVSRAIELRFIVEPTVPGTGRAESVTCLLIARYTDWTCARAQRRARAADFARELGALLAVTISDHTFTPVTHADAVRRALDPCPIVDTGEARRRAPDGAPAPGLPLPFLGIPDVEPVIDMMLRRDAPSVLSICVEPAALGAMALATAVEDRAGSGEESESPHRRWAAPDEPHGVLALTRVRDEATHIGWQVQRVLALRQQAYRLRIQLAGATRLGDGLIEYVGGRTERARAQHRAGRVGGSDGATWRSGVGPAAVDAPAHAAVWHPLARGRPGQADPDRLGAVRA